MFGMFKNFENYAALVVSFFRFSLGKEGASARRVHLHTFIPGKAGASKPSTCTHSLLSWLLYTKSSTQCSKNG